MSSQPESAATDRYYAAERLAELRVSIPQLMTAMVIQRARVEQAKDTDRTAARDAYAELARSRKALVANLADVRLFLLEAEEYALAPVAGQLHDGMLAYDLMSTNYKSVYDAVCAFAKRLPIANSIFVIDDAKQRDKMTEEFYAEVRKEIALYQERADYFIKSGCCSPAVLERWVSKIGALEEKKRHYENILRRELNGLDDDFTVLKGYSQELSIRARGIRARKAA